ncbi:MAG: winged helix-turn-helix transcriptional regulator [Gemmatimonadaceae bacterium]
MCIKCPLVPVLELFGSSWKHQILWVLSIDTLRFNELHRALSGITPKTLTNQLRELERDGLVLRTQYPEIPPRVEYSITELGRSLTGVFQQIEGWGESHLGQVAASRSRYDQERKE